VIKEFASDDAVVVIGTVIDPEVQDELRVTVVATGLRSQRQANEAPMKLVRNTAGEVDYEQLQRPTAFRKQPKHDVRAETKKDMDLEYLDIPAFLRRQAD
jgi:cell division protein FtsZ